MSEPRHYGHDEGAWFWGCAACNPVGEERITSLDVGSFGRPSGRGSIRAADMDLSRVVEAKMGGSRQDWYCPVCRSTMSSWHGTPLRTCGRCGQAETPLTKAIPAEAAEDGVGVSDLYRIVAGMVSRLSEEEKLKLLDELPFVCPYDCDSGCHDEDCPCDRLGCAGSEHPGAR